MSGYSLSGRIDGVDAGTLTIVVNGEVVAGTVRTSQGTYRMRSAGGGAHVVSQIDESRSPAGSRAAARAAVGCTLPVARPERAVRTAQRARGTQGA